MLCRFPQIRARLARVLAVGLALLVVAPVPALAAGGNSQSTPPASTAKASSKPAHKAPAFHPDQTPLDPSVAAQSGKSGSGAASVGSTSGTVVRTIVGLAVVLAVVYGVYWLLKSAARARTGTGDERISVVATTPLATNRSLHLIQSGDELILVGATEHSITPLRVYSAEEAAALELQMRAAAQPGAPASPRGPKGLLQIIRQMTVR